MMPMGKGNPQPTLFRCVKIRIIGIRIDVFAASSLTNDLTNCRKEKEEVKGREAHRKEGGQEIKVIVARNGLTRDGPRKWFRFSVRK